MNHLVTATVLALSLSVSACIETQVGSKRGRFSAEHLPCPNRIVVYDFDTTTTEVVLDPSIPKEIARGRTPIAEAQRQTALAVADVLSRKLVDEILALGLPAEWGYQAPIPEQGALIIDGQLIRIDGGNRRKRTMVGFGAGESELRTQVQVYRVTDRGRQLIAEFETVTEVPEDSKIGDAAAVIDADSRRFDNPDDDAPSRDAVRTATKAAGVLAELFEHQGWIPEHRE